MFALILIEYKVKELDKSFTYMIPLHLKEKLKVGMRVLVPFGSKNNLISGFVLKILNACDTPCKEVNSILNENLVLNEELLHLGYFLKESTLCTLISAYQSMLPSPFKLAKKNGNMTKTVKFIRTNESKKELERILFSLNNEKQKKIIEDLLQNDKIIKRDYSASSCQTLIKKGIIFIEDVPIYRINPEGLKIDKKPILSEEQLEAYDAICKSINKEETFLLHGVTGSGKTEVYLHLIEKIYNEGKSAIMLVPEITISMQIINTFYKRFGSDVAILHSGLRDGEKYDEYLKIYNGEARIVVGTRSAIFAPVTNLGIIIIDEEHSDSYKQDNNPKYNAISIAEWRSKWNHIPLILGSATPSYTSYAKASKGVYTLLTMTKRVLTSKVPSIKLVDMNEEVKKGNRIISASLKEKISDRLLKREQIMILLNRRGFGTLVNCDTCNYTYKCPNCNITLTYHKSSESLKCHYCNYTIKKDSKCPKCKVGEIRTLGIGTERVETEIKSLFPEAKTIRMDADTTTKKGSHEKIINDFKDHKYDILIGTQMISKGLDFERVSLVGVINADASLNIPDFRSGERTFALLNQVSGRAGRSGLDSDVIIQSYHTDNFTIKMAKLGSYMSNYKYEMSIRKLLKYPPYYYLASIKVCSKEFAVSSKESYKIVSYLRNHLDSKSIILGPSMPGIFRLNGIYRFQIVIKYRFDNFLKKTLFDIDSFYIGNKNVYIEIDMDPYNI